MEILKIHQCLNFKPYVGAKAATLGTLVELNYLVPRGVVIR